MLTTDVSCLSPWDLLPFHTNTLAISDKMLRNTMCGTYWPAKSFKPWTCYRLSKKASVCIFRMWPLNLCGIRCEEIEGEI
jgi:hypothetical protein